MLNYLKKHIKVLKSINHRVNYFLFLNKNTTDHSYNLFFLDREDIDIVTIAFNNPKMIEYQIKFLNYVNVPINEYFRNKSHKEAMHWIYKNVLRKRNNLYFGFLYHYIFHGTLLNSKQNKKKYLW